MVPVNEVSNKKACETLGKSDRPAVAAKVENFKQRNGAAVSLPHE
jgi:hypothetical protein